MDPNLKRRGSFLDIGYGKLGIELQAEYEKAAQIACERSQPVTITMNITVIPPQEQNIGKVMYDLTTKLPKRTSIQYDACYDKGVIIATAPRDVGFLQESLYFDDEPPTKTQKEEVSNG